MMRGGLKYILLWLLVGSISCTDDGLVDGRRLPSASTQRTIDLIDSVMNAENASYNITRNIDRTERYLEAWERNEGLSMWKRYIVEQAKSGNFAQTSIIQQNSFPDGKITEDQLNKGSLIVYELMALGYLRVAIEHEGQPLILRSQGMTPHSDPQYAQGALQLFELILRKFPERNEQKWYYNLCHMMVGTYPDGVPSQYLIPLDSMMDYQQTIRYDNTASAKGIEEFRNGGPAVWLDLDADGDQDLLSFSRDLKETVHVYENQNGSFTDITKTSGIDGLTGGAIAAPADVDGDGDLDVFVGRGKYQGPLGRSPMSLLINQGDGTLSDEATTSGLTDLKAVVDADWVDYDGDGDMDLFVATEPDRDQGLPQYYLNDGTGVFTEGRREVIPQVMREAMRCVELMNLNADSLPDLLVSYLQFRPFLWLSTDSTMNKVPSPMKWHQSTSAIVPVDVDNDGDRDLILLPHNMEEGQSTIAFADQMVDQSTEVSTKLFINQGDTSFIENNEALGTLRWQEAVYAATPVDIDLDGDMDLYVSTGSHAVGEYIPNRLYINDGTGRYSDGTYVSGSAVLSQSYGIAVANVDGDPLPEIFVNGGGFYEGDHAHSILLDPTSTNDHNYLVIRLEGTSSNRLGIGAKVAIHALDNEGKTRVVYHYPELQHGLAMRQVDLPVGLGAVTAITKVVVTWPDGSEQVLTEVQPDTELVIRQAAG